MNKKILFVCKYNRFRSQVAERFFNKLNKNKKYSAISRGLFIGNYPLDKNQVRAAKKFGLKLNGKPKAISTKILSEIDVLVIVADDVPSEIFNSKLYGKTEFRFEVMDDHTGTEERAIEVISNIEKKIKQFILELK